MNMKPALILKLADIAIQVALIICVNIDAKGLEGFLQVCGATLLWQLTSSIIHFFVKADWKKKSLRTLFVSMLLVSSVFAVVTWATFVLAFISVLMALFCGPILVVIYLVISVGELKTIYTGTERGHHIDHIQSH